MAKFVTSTPEKMPKPPSGQASRRLAAILMGDIFGYSRLMHQEEDETIARVRRIKRDVLDPTIAEHDGRLVDTAGDGFLAVFDSPVEAVRCGIVIQQSMVARNAMLAREHWIQYRIGINLGDVLFEEGSVYGDGVNVAARLEGIAEPGQIYISGGIYEQVKHKVVCGYESLGDRQVKNITDPVKVYRVLPDPSALRESKRRPWVIMLTALAAFVLVLMMGGGAAWYLLTVRSGQVNSVAAPVAAPTEMAKAPPFAAPSPQPAPPHRRPHRRAASRTDRAASRAARAAGCASRTASRATSLTDCAASRPRRAGTRGDGGSDSRATAVTVAAVGEGAGHGFASRWQLRDGQQRGRHRKAYSSGRHQAFRDRQVSCHRSRME